MSRKLLLIAGILLQLNSSLAYPRQLSTRRENISIKGKWIIEKFYPGSISAFDDSAAMNLLNKILIINNDSLIFNNVSYPILGFEEEKVNTSDYFINGYRIDPKKLGLNEKKVKVIKIIPAEGSALPIYALIISSDYCIFNMEGYFFFIKKME